MAQQMLQRTTDQDLRIPMTYEEFLALVDESLQAEWVNGEAIIFMPPTVRHQSLISFLSTLLTLYTSLFKLGEVLIAPCAMRLWPDGPSREPDIFFVAHEHRDRLTTQGLEGPADLVVEIVSESSSYRDRTEKFAEYLQAGVREYLLIDQHPGHEALDWFQQQTAGRYQAIQPDAAGRYHSTVLPGFWLNASWLWQPTLPAPLDVLTEIAPDALQAFLHAKLNQPR